jgi:dihydroxy-acid dehydratase
MIEVDIPKRKLRLLVSDRELNRRAEHFTPMVKESRGALRRYSLLAESADKGAVLSEDL